MIAPVRLDKFLWAIRLFKTRSQATVAIDSGKVRWKELPVKPSRTVAIGDVYDIITEARRWQIEVTAILPERVAYPEAIKHYKDLTPEEDKLLKEKIKESFFTGKRLSKTGRPTKKQRREIEDFLD